MLFHTFILRAGNKQVLEIITTTTFSRWCVFFVYADGFHRDIFIHEYHILWHSPSPLSLLPFIPPVSLLLSCAICIFYISIQNLWFQKAMPYLSFWIWFASLGMIISSCIHFPAIDVISFFFMVDYNTFLYLFILLQTSRLILWLAYCEWGCSKHWWEVAPWLVDQNSLGLISGVV